MSRPGQPKYIHPVTNPAIGRLASIWKSNIISLAVKIKVILISLVLLILLYGADLWPICHTDNKKAVLSQRWPRNAPYTWVPWKFSGLPDYAHGYYSQQFSRAFVRIDPLNVLQNLKSVALSVPQIIGGSPKIWTVPGYAFAPFSAKFLIGFYSDWPYKCKRQICSP